MSTGITHHSPAPGWTAQVLAGILIVYCYYQGLYKLMFFDSYMFWLAHTPFLKKAPVVFACAVPAFDFATMLLLMIGTTRNAALRALIIAETFFVAWVLYVLTYTPYLFWPWQVLWGGKLQWFYKLLESLLAAWMAAALLYLRYWRKKKN